MPKSAKEKAIDHMEYRARCEASEAAENLARQFGLSRLIALNVLLSGVEQQIQYRIEDDETELGHLVL